MSIPYRHRGRSRSGVPLSSWSRQSYKDSESRTAVFNAGGGGNSQRPVSNRTYSNASGSSVASSQATARSTIATLGLASVAESEDALKKGELKEGRKANVEQGNYGAAYYKTMTIAQLKLQNPYVDIINQNIDLARELKKAEDSTDPPSKHLAKLNKHDAMSDLTNFDTDFERWLTLTYAAHMRHAYEQVAKSEIDPTACAVFVFVQYAAPKLGSTYHSRMVLSGKNLNVRTDADPAVRNGFCSGLTDDEVKTRFIIRGSKVIGDEDLHSFLQRVGKQEEEALKLVDTMVQERTNTANKGKTAGFLYFVMMVNGEFRTELTQFILPGVQELPKIKEALEEKSAAIDAKQQQEIMEVQRKEMQTMIEMGRIHLRHIKKVAPISKSGTPASKEKDGNMRDVPSPNNSGLGQDQETEYDGEAESMGGDGMAPAEECEDVDFDYTSSEGEQSDDEDQESEIVEAAGKSPAGIFGKHVAADESIIIERSDDDGEGSDSGVSSTTGQYERSDSGRSDDYVHSGSEDAPLAHHTITTAAAGTVQTESDVYSFNAYGNFQHALERRVPTAGNNSNPYNRGVPVGRNVQQPGRVHRNIPNHNGSNTGSYDDFQAYRNMEMMAAAAAAARRPYGNDATAEQPQQYDYHGYIRPSKRPDFW